VGVDPGLEGALGLYVDELLSGDVVAVGGDPGHGDGSGLEAGDHAGAVVEGGVSLEDLHLLPGWGEAFEGAGAHVPVVEGLGGDGVLGAVEVAGHGVWPWVWCGPRVAWVEMRIGGGWVRLRGEGGVGISGGREAAGLTGTEGPEV
jgi:hypothetical protein